MSNKQRWKMSLSLVILFGVIFTSACAKPQTQNTPIPSPTPSKVPPTLTPRPATPRPTPTHARVVVTDIPLLYETPTPIATPPGGASAYQLKDWNEESALGLVAIAEQFALADNVGFFFSSNRFNYQGDQDAIKLAAQEALYRFPNTLEKERLEWRIALADTILEGPASDDWILKEIEKALNTGRVTPGNLYQLLNPFGFDIGQQESAPNLFGDGQPAQVLWITRQDRQYTGLYAALRQDNQGKYNLIKIYSSWNFDYGSDEPFKFGDHTGDGVPEVILLPSWHNGTYCGFTIEIFQWRMDHFADLSQRQFSFDECDFVAIDSWSFSYGNPNENGTESIETQRSASLFSGVVRYQLYGWNGREYKYELKENRLIPPQKIDNRTSGWVTYAMKEGDYQNIIDRIPQILSDESQLEEMAPDLGPSYLDYLRFQLALAHVFQSEDEEARSIFNQIVQSPQNPSNTAISRAAQAYLDSYNSDIDVYRACQAALRAMERTLGKYSWNIHSDDYDTLEQKWGYKPDLPWDSIVLCNLPNAFKRTIAQLDVAQFAEAPEQLKNAGVLIRSAIEVDLDNNGQMEWVLLVDTPGADTPLSTWVLLNTSDNIQPIRIVPQYALSFRNPETAKLDVKTISSPEGKVIDLVSVGQHLHVFQLDSSERSIVWLEWVPDGVESYTIHQRDNDLVLEVIENTDDCKQCKHTYLWFDGHFEWIPEGTPPDWEVNEAESTLLSRWRPDEAIPLLQSILETTSPTSYGDTPHLMYLLGLAYELTGDDVLAVETYWKIWHDYPETPYARLAQAKLEPRK